MRGSGVTIKKYRILLPKTANIVLAVPYLRIYRQPFQRPLAFLPLKKEAIFCSPTIVEQVYCIRSYFFALLALQPFGTI
jgi:hypothetical protein